MRWRTDVPAASRPAVALQWAAVFLAGAAVGFFGWSCSVAPEVLHSLFFSNNLAASQRSWLLLSILAGGAALVLVWKAACVAGMPRRVADWLSLGILLGFWPFLNIPALEVYHPFQAFSLMIGLLAVLFWMVRRLSASTPSTTSTAGWGRRWSLPAVLLLSCGYALFFGLYTLGKHLCFHSYALDLGWENQVLYTLLRSGSPRVTMFITMNPFANHLWAAYYLLVPLYAIHPDPATLLLLQAVLLASGAVPLFLIARRRLGKPWLGVLIALGYLLYPALHGLNTYDFHGIVLLIPVVCFLLYFLETGRMKLFWVFLVLALLVREDASISLLGVGLYLWLGLNRRREGLLSMAACVGYFLLSAAVMTALGGSPNLENYWDLGLPERQNFVGVALTLLTNPWYAFKLVFFNADKWIFLLQILVPVLFLPLFSGRRLVLLIPGLAIILLSGNDAQYSIGYQYSAHIIPAVFFLSICGLERLGLRWTKMAPRIAPWALLLAALLMNYEYGLVFSKRFPGFFELSQRERTAYSLFQLVPPDASVATISRLYPHLSSRREIYLLEHRRSQTEFILIDLYPPEPAVDSYEASYRGHALSTFEVKNAALEILSSDDFGVLRYENGFLLLRRGLPAAGNNDVAGKIRAFSAEAVPEIVPYFRDPAQRVSAARLSESDRFIEYLRRHPTETIILVGNGDVLTRLSYRAKIYLIRRGSNLLPLRSGGSYGAVIRGTKVVFELIANRSPVDASTSTSECLRRAVPELDVTLRSVGDRAGGEKKGGDEAGSFVSVNGKAYPAERRGLNLVVLDRFLNVTAQESFATGR